jgi:hypothetical protein
MKQFQTSKIILGGGGQRGKRNITFTKNDNIFYVVTKKKTSFVWRFEDSNNLKNSVFWDVTPFVSCKN